MKLEEYGFIGDMRGAALVGANGSIDWLCLPRFDSDACCSALLGDSDNGFWKISPTAAVFSARQAYRGATVILETEFRSPTSRARLVDFMPVSGPHQVVRVIEGLEGEMEFESTLSLCSGYGRCVPWLKKNNDGSVTAISGPDAWLFQSDAPPIIERSNVVTRCRVTAGAQRTFTLTWHASFEQPSPNRSAAVALAETQAYWEEWAARCTYSGPWRDAVLRSLLTLKALTFSATGGIVAAATTSLPEKIGGVRNWDYRFCWLRDATFTLLAFLDAGYTEEAVAWTEWLLRAAAGDPGQIQIMYGVAGERRLHETILPHLRGYENSRPVRIGNAASEQFQLDVYGEVIDALHAARIAGLSPSAEAWKLEVALIEFVCRSWTLPDEGIWEIRGPRRHFVHSKLMAWVALDRAVKAVEQFKLPGDFERWRQIRQSIHDDVCTHGVHPLRGVFTQYYGSEKLDASLLMMPLVGFLPAYDPRVRATVEAIESELSTGGMVYRYHPEESASVDGLPPGEGTFLPCSFWLADCLIQMGREDDARRLFETLLGKTTPLGLLSEEFDLTRNRLVGNFPQAFSHVGLINSAQNLTSSGPAEQRSHS